ncbi:MAG: molybdopterin cofactor-binding domain-containing protein [Ilumatobacteraceae bacterium]
MSAAHDSGTIINQIGARGQVEGGVMMGIGQALTEGTRYDDAGRQRNPAMLEYKLQTCADAPPIHIDFVEIPTPDAGPRGARGSPRRRTCPRLRRSPMRSHRWSAAPCGSSR